MRTGDLFFIIIILIAACFGGIAAFAASNDPTQTTDTWGTPTSNQTNLTAEAIKTTAAQEAGYQSIFIIFGAFALVITIILAIIFHLKKGNYGGGRYRTG